MCRPSMRRARGLLVLVGVLGLTASRVPAASAAENPDSARDTLAWVGARAVTAAELERRMEAAPWPEDSREGGADSANVRALESLVGEKLLAQEAERRGLASDRREDDRRAALTRALARDALFRTDVGGDTTRAAAVLTRVLAGRSVRVDPPLFRLLCDSLRTRVQATQADRAGRPGRLRLLPEDVDAMRAELAGQLDRTLVHLPDGRLTLADVLEDMRFYAFTVRSLEPEPFAVAMNSHLKFIVERDLLAGEAIRLHLDRRPEVVADLAEWTDAWRAQALGRTLTGPRELDHVVAALARRDGVRLAPARAAAMSISLRRMLLRRLLGFGGGMPAAPGIPPDFGWAPLWRGDRTALP